MFSDFYSKLTAQERKIFYVALLVVLFMIADRLFLGPALSKMKTYDEEIAQQERSIQQDLRFLAYKNRILEDDKALAPYYANAYKTEDEVIASFLKKIEMIATDSKVNLIKVTPAESKERKGYKEYFANLECEGLLENIASFMHTVDTSQDLLKITKVNFSLKRPSGDEVLVGMVVSKMFIGEDLAKTGADLTKKESPQTEASSGSGSAAEGQGKKTQSNTGDTSSGSSGGQKSKGPEKAPSSGTGGSANKDPQQKDKENSASPQPQATKGKATSTSQRYQMKGFKPSPKDLKKTETAPPADELQASIFEKIMTKTVKDYPAGQEQDVAGEDGADDEAEE